MNDLLPPGKITFQRTGHDGPVGLPWNAADLNLKANVVCKACNETWMSCIEARHARPWMTDLIIGNAVEVTVQCAYGVALFAFKTAVVTNHILPQNERFFSVSQRRKFRHSLRIPPRVKMWLVGMSGDLSGGVKSTNVYFPDQSAPDLTLNVCSFYVGQLGFQVISAKTRTIKQVESLPGFTDLTVPFHPTIAPGIRWPRAKLLETRDFHKFANRWNSVKSS